MKTPRQIEIYKIRRFGDVIGDAFTLWFRHIKDFSSLFLLWCVPFFVIAAVSQLLSEENLFDMFIDIDRLAGSDDFSFVKSLIIQVSTFGLSYALAGAGLFTSTAAYLEELHYSNGQSVDLALVHKRIRSRYLKVLGFTILIGLAFGVVYVGIVMLMTVIHVGFGFLFLPMLPVLIYLAVVLLIAPAALTCEDSLGIGSALKRCISLISGHWWWTFGVNLISGFIRSMLGYIFSIPMFILMISKGIMAIDAGAPVDSGIWGNMALFFSLIGGLYVLQYQAICNHLAYFRFIEEKEGRSLQEKVDTVEVKENPNFGNEGGF